MTKLVCTERSSLESDVGWPVADVQLCGVDLMQVEERVVVDQVVPPLMIKHLIPLGLHLKVKDNLKTRRTCKSRTRFQVNLSFSFSVYEATDAESFCCKGAMFRFESMIS